MSFWASAAQSLIYSSLVDQFARDQQAEDRMLGAYADYRSGVPDRMIQYFRKRPRETDDRYDARPKLTWPLCRLIVDAHAEARVKGLKVSIEDDATQAAWDEVAEHNELSAYWYLVAQTAGTYGYCFVRPMLHREGDKVTVEYDSFTPLECKPVYESCGAGRSVKRLVGVRISTGHSLINGEIFRWPMPSGQSEVAEDLNIKQRVEFISATRHLVWLDGKLTPESAHGDIWMPGGESGVNPYGFLPIVLFNNLETEEAFTGVSDIHTTIYDAQQVFELWSDIVHMTRVYLPTGVLKTDEVTTKNEYAAGIGLGVAVESDGDFGYANPAIDFAAVTRPMEIALETLYANAKMPAVALGLERIFGSAARQINIASGASKVVGWKPVVSHATNTRRPFGRGVRKLVQNTLRMISSDKTVSIGGNIMRLGLGAEVDAEAKIMASFSAEIIPESASEKIDRINREIASRVKSAYQGVIDYNGWESARAQREVDMMGAELNASRTGLPFKDVVAAVMARQQEDVSDADRAAAADVLFSPPPVMKADDFMDGEQ